MKSSILLKQEALDYRYNQNVPLKLYLSTCVSIIEEAQICSRNNDIERSYLLYMRYLDLCLNKLVHHSEVNVKKDSLHRKEYLQLIKLEVPAIMKITEDLKSKLDARFVSLANNVATQTHAKTVSVDTLEALTLPSTFDEKKFNESIRWFRTSNKKQPEGKSSSHEYPDLPELNIQPNRTYTMPAL